MINKAYIIAIDGRAAAGKTSLAAKLSDALGASVIHMDDFFLLPELRTEERLAEPGGNIHYERFKDEIISKLSLGEAFSYQRFDCRKKALTDWIQISKSPVIIVEGSYSHHPFFGDYADLKIFKNIDSHTQWQRILSRDGNEWGQIFKNKWIPLEEKYIDAFNIETNADIIL